MLGIPTLLFMTVVCINCVSLNVRDEIRVSKKVWDRKAFRNSCDVISTHPSTYYSKTATKTKKTNQSKIFLRCLRKEKLKVFCSKSEKIAHVFFAENSDYL